MKKKFIQGGFREILTIAVPLVITNSAFTVMQFCDRIFLARYDDLAIQAALPAGILAFALMCLFIAIGGYSGTLVAQYFGAGERLKCVHSTVQGIYFNLLCLPIFIALIPLGYWLIDCFGHSAELVVQERMYFAWMMFSAVPVGLGWAISGFFTGRSRVRLNTISNVIGCVINIVLDYALIFGKFGLPEWGLKGAAIATCIASCVSPTIQLGFMLRSKIVRELGYRKAFTPDWPIMGKLIRFGVPSGVQNMLDVGAFAFFVMMTARLDSVSLTASNVALSINSLAFSPLMGFGAAASIKSGQYKGAGEFDYAMKSGWSSLKLGLCYMAIIGSVFVLLPETLLSLFFSQGETGLDKAAFLRTGTMLMYLMTVWGIFDTATIVLIGALKGVGDTRFVMVYLSLMAWFFWIPGELLIFKFGGGIVHAWILLAFYISVLSFGFAKRWHGGKWMAIRVIDP